MKKFFKNLYYYIVALIFIRVEILDQTNIKIQEKNIYNFCKQTSIGYNLGSSYVSSFFSDKEFEKKFGEWDIKIICFKSLFLKRFSFELINAKLYFSKYNFGSLVHLLVYSINIKRGNLYKIKAINSTKKLFLNDSPVSIFGKYYRVVASIEEFAKGRVAMGREIILENVEKGYDKYDKFILVKKVNKTLA